MLLFDDEFGVDNSPIDDTQITTTLLYFSETELKEFKAKSKEAMRRMYGHEAMTKGNLSDLLLNLLNTYVNENAQATPTL